MNEEDGRAEAPPLRIFVVEDDPKVRDLVRLVLATERYALQFAGDARSARAAIAGLTADVALIDLGLPDGTGLDVLAALQAAYPSMPALVLTVEHDRERILACFQAGADGYLLKEDLTARLESSILDAREGRAPMSPEAARAVLTAVRRGEASDADPTLTARELEVLSILGRGLTYDETATILGISANTVRTHVRATYEKLGVASKAEAVAWAMRRRLID